ncbi:hypothetical protein H6G17_07095 [Chroococcidiopsis sp. FACHB-1243]|uniref:hypothetical protein n=1 Tax=Chroococcidiopsis sp. [FACHB-1243] TaxID=2692781 RepID=UPI001782076B|nr:hypothetical protein [Chroococcidiopsis sp. [FACHB-1243]]MBD2305278.1 hypothetical protein [Chroococcidiopsis sp. [FACHB-1243]]
MGAGSREQGDKGDKGATTINYQLPNYPLPTTNYQLPTTNCIPFTSNLVFS